MLQTLLKVSPSLLLRLRWVGCGYGVLGMGNFGLVEVGVFGFVSHLGWSGACATVLAPSHAGGSPAGAGELAGPTRGIFSPVSHSFDPSKRHVSDFYISDFQSGLRALVKTGYGARVTPYVEESIVVDIDQSNRDMSPEFVRWLAERNLSSDDRIMRLKEGYIKEGSTVSVMGVVQRNDNVLMIVPPEEPFSTGCQWTKCILPASLEGIILRCEDSSKIDVIPV
ncbi:hypothetical protein FXO37_34322 [Capsicum annuum]|nr:hypothetical protein FXO37_34322 [Capsicum annuum]